MKMSFLMQTGTEAEFEYWEETYPYDFQDGLFVNISSEKQQGAFKRNKGVYPATDLEEASMMSKSSWENKKYEALDALLSDHDYSLSILTVFASLLIVTSF